MIGKDKQRQTINVEESKQFAEELNAFYSRFDNQDFSNERVQVSKSISESDSRIHISEEEII